MAGQSKNKTIIVGMLIVAGAVYSGRYLLIWLMLSLSFGNEKLEEYQQFCIDHGCRDVASGRAITIRGKVLLFVPARKKTGSTFYYYTDGRCMSGPGRIVEDAYIDREMRFLPSAIRAGSPDAVGTIMICERDTATAGFYSATGTGADVDTVMDAAIRYKVTLKAYDAASGEFLGCEVHMGGQPKAMIIEGESQSGERVDVVGIISDMPRRR